MIPVSPSRSVTVRLEPAFLRLIGGLFVLLLLSFIIGCGGGSGGSGTDNGTGVDPLEIEVNTSLDLFLSAIASGNIDLAMQEVDSNLQYYRKDSTVLGYQGFKTCLANFLAGAASISITIAPRAVVPDGETAAIIRGTLKCTYIDKKTSKSISSEELCEIYYARVPKVWGIQRLSGQNFTTLVFPAAF
ncbi:MAG: hypothetical protein HQM09_03190 [Candidatus Riflebacteria bacterium]|nr:hypothetical protein [Candidatus Riflebacteria bacterium]